MPIIKNNKFQHDNFNIRLERLIAIEGNFAQVQSELNVPEYIAEWTLNCRTIYMDLIADANYFDGSSKGATRLTKENVAKMLENYQKTKTIAKIIYRNEPAIFESFMFDARFPISRNDKLARVEMVLNLHQELVEKSYPVLIPEGIIAELSQAKNDLKSAIAHQEIQISELHVASIESRNRFLHDTRILQDLKLWWYLKMGKNDPRIGLIGMVNPKPGGNPHKQRKKIDEEDGN